MARFKDSSVIAGAFSPHLDEGETVQHAAYGVKQPPIWAIFLLFCCAILPGAIAVALLTKEYVVALTERRFIALRFKSKKIDVREVLEYTLGEMKDLKTSKGKIFTHIEIKDPEKPFRAKFHRMGTKDNRENSQAIADALEAQKA